MKTVDSSSAYAKASDSLTETTTAGYVSYPSGYEGIVSSEWITSSSTTPVTTGWSGGIISSDCTLPFKAVGAGNAVIDKCEEKITKAEENIHRVEKELEKLEENIDYLAEQSCIHEKRGKDNNTEIDLLHSDVYAMQQGINDLKSNYLTLHEDVKRIDSMVQYLFSIIQEQQKK